MADGKGLFMKERERNEDLHAAIWNEYRKCANVVPILLSAWPPVARQSARMDEKMSICHHIPIFRRRHIHSAFKLSHKMRNTLVTAHLRNL